MEVMLSKHSIRGCSAVDFIADGRNGRKQHTVSAKMYFCMVRMPSERAAAFGW